MNVSALRSAAHLVTSGNISRVATKVGQSGQRLVQKAIQTIPAAQRDDLARFGKTISHQAQGIANGVPEAKGLFDSAFKGTTGQRRNG